jgi:hypothetical protein
MFFCGGEAPDTAVSNICRCALPVEYLTSNALRGYNLIIQYKNCAAQREKWP